jgi:hypothetical protein
MVTAPHTTTYRYARWKALLFGVVPAGLGGLMIGLGVYALDPAWTAQVARGQYLVDAPVWVRSPVMFATGAAVLIPGLWLLFAALRNSPVVIANDRMIAARTLFGRLRQLDWDAIVAAKRKKNQIILSPLGVNTLGQEIWDRKSVFQDIGMLDAAAGEIEALVHSHRPDVAIPLAAG